MQLRHQVTASVHLATHQGAAGHHFAHGLAAGIFSEGIGGSGGGESIKNMRVTKEMVI
jgi:hypothetical protein